MESVELEENKVGESMGLYRKQSGLIFDDTFAELNARWQLSPSSAVYLDVQYPNSPTPVDVTPATPTPSDPTPQEPTPATPTPVTPAMPTPVVSQLVLAHSDQDTMVLFDLPQNEHELLLQVTADYVPTKAGDEGGIIIWKDGYFKLEFLESLDTTTREYSQWRAHKIGTRWEFSADRGSGYELFDSAFLDATKAGVILKNPYEDGYEPLRLDRVILCRGTKVSVGNLGPGYTVYLCDENGYEVRSLVVPPEHSGVEFELPTIPFTGMIRVFDVGNVFLSSIGPTVMYGGDIFLLGTDLEVWWNGKELSVDGSTYLGTMYDNQILVQMEVRNPTTATYAKDIKVSVLQYLNEFGYEWVDVAPDVGGVPGEFADQINIGDLAPQEVKYIWVKVTRLEPRFQLDPADFVLDITHL